MGKLVMARMDGAAPKRKPVPKRVASDLWLTPQQAADRLGVHVDTIYRALDKDLEHIKAGHSTIRIRVEWFDAWADSKKVSR